MHAKRARVRLQLPPSLPTPPSFSPPRALTNRESGKGGLSKSVTSDASTPSPGRTAALPTE